MLRFASGDAVDNGQSGPPGRLPGAATNAGRIPTNYFWNDAASTSTL
jgi:hypothetical protein